MKGKICPRSDFFERLETLKLGTLMKSSACFEDEKWFGEEKLEKKKRKLLVTRMRCRL